ncbi:hypothetical protein PAPYR_9766 [Paratrimastix pyriformis]|uniref:Polycystin cation channel PKD1/PKD2 domain-containing protein n=1 Tax=Paratrimastix pyriformis TaxID=342808 RepID=A0ABQ8UA53_9EUKA|nr:hypothetical protein PAPYR_9766 [Paratrimastix pyriformis]
MRKPVSRARRCLGRCCLPAPASLEDELFLSPWKKFLKYRQIPWKFLFHSLLCVLTLFSVLLPSGFTIREMISDNQRAITRHSLPDFDGELFDSNKERAIYLCSWNDTKEAFTRAITAYFRLNETTLAQYQQLGSTVGLSYEFYDDLATAKVNTVNTEFDEDYEDNPLVTAWFDKDFYPLLRRGSVNFAFLSSLLEVSTGTTVYWDVRVDFDFQDRGCLRETIDIGVFIAHVAQAQFNVEVALDVLVVFICVGLAYHLVVSLYRGGRLFRSLEGRLGPEARAAFHWSQLPMSIKLKFFDLWDVCSLISVVCNTVSAFLDYLILVGLYNSDAVADCFMGVGAAAAIVDMIRYLEYFPKFRVLVYTLRYSILDVLCFFVVGLILFMAYAVVGEALFSDRCVRFQDLGTSAATLFALLHGDEITQIFNCVYTTGPFLSRLYMYTYVFGFIVIVLYIFIQLIQHAHAHHTAHNAHDLGGLRAGWGGEGFTKASEELMEDPLERLERDMAAEASWDHVVRDLNQVAAERARHRGRGPHGSKQRRASKAAAGPKPKHRGSIDGSGATSGPPSSAQPPSAASSSGGGTGRPAVRHRPEGMQRKMAKLGLVDPGAEAASTASERSSDSDSGPSDAEGTGPRRRRPSHPPATGPHAPPAPATSRPVPVPVSDSVPFLASVGGVALVPNPAPGPARSAGPSPLQAPPLPRMGSSFRPGTTPLLSSSLVPGPAALGDLQAAMGALMADLDQWKRAAGQAILAPASPPLRPPPSPLQPPPSPLQQPPSR